MSSSSVRPGFIAVHGNRTEWLLETVIQRVAADPLAPLESEVILVQNNGMGEWVRMALAQHLGISAAVQFRLPARFQWSICRQLLGRAEVPEQSALDKEPLTWRIMRVLSDIQRAPPEPAFEPLNAFLGRQADEPLRRHQLALRIADLFEQYQVHRPDWLQAWAAGQTVLISAAGVSTPLPAEQRWQALLWWHVLSELEPAQRELTRHGLQQRVIRLLRQDHPPHEANRLRLVVPRRIIVFGVTHLPLATLELLSALAHHSQVMMAIPNPCRFHWADIIDGRELLRQARTRHPLRGGRVLSSVALQHMHDHAHPLLAAWGRQGRDFIRQLDAFDDIEAARQRFPLQRFELFDHEEPADTLLRQVQARIRDLDPVQAHQPAALAPTDRSIVFHIAHSPVRELEILHDQLLSLLANPPEGRALRPRDMVVMVPDIQTYAPSIRAVFGQYDANDPRHIPFDIADLPARGSSPLMTAIEWLLGIAHDRLRLPDVCGLFNVPAIAARFDVPAESVDTLVRWMHQSGMRWGLDAQHRADLALAACGDAQTLRFGLRRLLMGYAVGGALDAIDAPSAYGDIEPLSEVGGLEAGLVGALSGLVDSLARWYQESRTEASPEAWVLRLRNLLADFFKPADDTDRKTLTALEEALQHWLDQCKMAGFEDSLPLAVAGTVWLDTLERPGLRRRFRAGGLTFCTLTPMRAIPFELVCLLGMNDRDFPRRNPRSDFDLIALSGQSRPGDRARRDDDRQLMLEALLSARRVLYISWCGRSIRDNSRQPPSVLVSQLRDYLAAAWSDDAVSTRTTEHPLQPFSRRYFELGTPLFTHAAEWRAAHDRVASGPAGSVADSVDPIAAGSPLSIARLAQFLRNPTKAFFRHRLQVVFDEGLQALPDEEAFSVDGLERHSLIEYLSDRLIHHLSSRGADRIVQIEVEPILERLLDRLSRSGGLPMGGPGLQTRNSIKTMISPMINAWRAERAAHPVRLHRLALRHEHAGVVLEDWLDQRLAAKPQSENGVWLTLTASQLLVDQKKQTLRPDRLIGVWVRSLLAATANCADLSIVVGRDCLLKIYPLATTCARDSLSHLLEAWVEGQQQPLPIAPRTALAFIASGDNSEALRTYEGGEFSGAEVDDPCLARCYPDFEALSADGRFARLAEQLYSPLARWARDHIEVTSYDHQADPQAGDE
jgi:exodeoxyribonuclease V gamma subunit